MKAFSSILCIVGEMHLFLPWCSFMMNFLFFFLLLAS